MKQESPEPKIHELNQYRHWVYTNVMTKARDAQIELVDALLATPQARSVVSLSLSPVYQRQWSSIYAALNRGQIDSHQLSQGHVARLPATERLLWVVDASTWPRPEARTMPERGFHHMATTTANTPVAIGHRYSTVVAIPEAQGSWVLPLSHERIPFEASEVAFAAQQVRRLVQAASPRPLVLADSLYAGPMWLNETADLPIDTLARLRSNRALYRRPVRRSPYGRQPLDGPVLNLRRPETWHDPDQERVVNDDDLGTVTLTVWHQLHFKTARNHEVSVIQVCLSKPRTRRQVEPALWLMYIGTTPLNLAKDWLFYFRRYAIEHWYRFIKRHLLWIDFAGTTLDNTQTWSHLVTIAYWQLWLARHVVADQRLPWEKRMSNPAQLTPGRVHRSVMTILAVIGPLARPPKPRGNSPGRRVGQKMSPRKRYPAQKKVRNPMPVAV